MCYSVLFAKYDKIHNIREYLKQSQHFYHIDRFQVYVEVFPYYIQSTACIFAWDHVQNIKSKVDDDVRTIAKTCRNFPWKSARKCYSSIIVSYPHIPERLFNPCLAMQGDPFQNFSPSCIINQNITCPLVDAWDHTGIWSTIWDIRRNHGEHKKWKKSKKEAARLHS